MPQSAPRPCCHPGCGSLVHDGSGRCDRHRKQQRQEQDAQRGSANARGYDSRWRKARATFLRRHPLCAEHAKAGIVVAATIVDHIVPHRGDQALFWDTGNWQSLCKTCHDSKTAREDGGFGRWRQ